MIGELPKRLSIDNKDFDIKSDFRNCLFIIQAFQSKELNQYNKIMIMLEILYKEIPDNKEEAQKQALWFLDGGNNIRKNSDINIVDFEQDEQLIFSAISNVAKYDIRNNDYLHWWSFLSYFMGMGESTYSNIINIRQKNKKGKKLEKWEREYYNENRDIVDLRKEILEMDEIMKQLRGD